MNIHSAYQTNAVYPIEMLVLSHSTRSSMRDCERKGIEFKQMFGTPPVEERDYSGETGQALHVGLAHWMLSQDEIEATVAFMMKFPYDLELLKPSNDGRSLEACFATLDQLMNSHTLKPYQVANIKTQAGEIRPCVEVPFAIKITGSPMPIPVWYVGLMDLILYNNTEDRFVVIDLKTTRQHLSDVYARFQFDEQVIPYGIILEHALGKRIEELDVNYLWAYIDILKPTHEMVEVKKTQIDIHDWLRGLCVDIDRIAKHYHMGWFPRATSGNSCISYNRKCHFFDECYFRDPVVLKSIINGTPRRELFRNGDQPWITAELPYMGA